MKMIEYRVRPVTRYIVTRCDWEKHENGNESSGDSSVVGKGEYETADMAYEVGYALCKAEHDQLGYPSDDERIQYPRHPASELAQADLSAASQLAA